MTADLFNNTSNDYIIPDVAPCPGEADSGSNTFEFLPNQQVGIISGSNIISAMNLGDISQLVTGWVQQTKILESGELMFIQGLTKGISYRTQYFLLADTSLITYSNWYMSVDLSINYYKNFRYYQDSIYATADYTNGVELDTALNIVLDAKGIKATALYVDACTLSFTGTQLGYYFNVTTVNSSVWTDVSIYGETMIEDVSSAIPAYKYPNTAMLGYVLKVTYPSGQVASDEWVEINHVPDYLTYYEAVDVSVFVDPSTWDASTYYIEQYKAVDVGLSGTACDSTTLSAADYLDWVETNGQWEKVGVLRIWLSASDPTTTNAENLITGFYVFNPQSFPVKIEYMTIL